MPAWSRFRASNDDERVMFSGRYFRRLLTAAFVFSAAINILQLSLPLYSLQVFTRAIPSGSIETLVALTVIVFIALAMSAALETVRSRLLVRGANALELAWRRRLSADVLDGAARGRPDAGGLNDLLEVKAAMTRPSLPALLDLPWMPIYVVGIYAIHPLLALLMSVSALILIALGFLGHVASKGLAEEGRQPTMRATRLLDAVQTRGAETVRGQRMAAGVLEAITRPMLAASALAAMSMERSTIFAAAIKWVRLLLQIACTAVGAWLVIENHLSFGGMIATSMLVGRAMAPIEQLVGGWTGIVKSAEALFRLLPLLKARARAVETAGVALAPDRLVAENLLYISPRDQKPILRAVSFAVEAGEVACVLGPNRAGKSVLARLLAGVQAPSAGTVRLGGLALATLTPAENGDGIGYLAQDAQLLPGTIADNIAGFRAASPEELAEAAADAGIKEWIEALPQRYETEVADPAFPLTGTAARAIALARAGFRRPALVILDEPVAGFDDQGLAAVRRFVKSLKAKGSVVVVLSCAPVLIDLAEKSYVLNNGVLVDLAPRGQGAQSPAAHPHVGHPHVGHPYAVQTQAGAQTGAQIGGLARMRPIGAIGAAKPSAG